MNDNRNIRLKMFAIMDAMGKDEFWEDEKNVWCLFCLWKKSDANLELFGDFLDVHSDNERIRGFSEKLVSMISAGSK